MTPAPDPQRLNPNTKQGRIVQAMVGGAVLDRFAAERHGDHVLPSTVALLQRRFGLTVSRRQVMKDSKFGRFWSCEYWLDETNRDRARRLLAAAGGK